MGKINRQGEASHVTTIVGETGKEEVVDLVPENLANSEHVEYDEDGKRLDREDDSDAKPERHGIGETNPVGDRNNPENAAPSGLGLGESLGATAEDGSAKEGQEGTFTATGEADVVEGDKPPVDQSVEKVKEWVGGDYVKAQRALEAEKADRNRSGLVSWLEKVAATR